MNPVEQILNSQGYLVLDGALASEMEVRGADLNDPLWSGKLLTTDSPLIKEVGLDYLLAGADIVTTNTYQSTVPGFIQKGFTEEQSISLIRKAVEISIETRDAFWDDQNNRSQRCKPIVCGSVGPYGAFLADGSEYRGDYNLSDDAFKKFHRSRMTTLADAGIDVFLFETFPSFSEARAIVSILKEFPTFSALLSFNCSEPNQIADGTPMKDVFQMINRSDQIAGVGINCVAPQIVTAFLNKAKEHTDKPLMIYPNSGEAWDATSKCWIPGSEQIPFEKKIAEWYDAGARIIGGCCRTSPDDIRCVREVLNLI